MARNASGVSSWLLVHNLGRLICSLHRRLEKISKATLASPAMSALIQLKIAELLRGGKLIFSRKLSLLLEKPSPKPSKRTQVLNRHAPWPSCQMALIRPPRAAPKNVEITSVRIPLQTLLSQTRKAREHMTTEHTVVRSGKLERKPFNSNVAGHLLTSGMAVPIRRRRKVPERIDTQTFNVLGNARRLRLS